jgi:hypothetical protein
MSVPVALIATAGGLALLGIIIFAARKATSTTSPTERPSTTSVESNSTPIARHGQESTSFDSSSNSESTPDSDYKSARGSISGGKSKRKKKTKRKSKKRL